MMFSIVKSKVDALLGEARRGAKGPSQVQSELKNLKIKLVKEGRLSPLDDFDIEAALEALEEIRRYIALYGFAPEEQQVAQT